MSSQETGLEMISIISKCHCIKTDKKVIHIIRGIKTMCFSALTMEMNEFIMK